MSWVSPHMQIHVAPRQRGLSGGTCNMSSVRFLSTRFKFFYSFLLYSFARAEPAPVERFWRSIRHTTFYRPRMCLLGVSFIPLFLLGLNPKKTILGLNRHFQRAKYYNLHIVETTAPIPTKFCTVTKTTKYSSCVVVDAWHALTQ